MNRRIIIIALLFNIHLCSGQNLIPNGNFESNSGCPTVGQLIEATPWINLASQFSISSPDYFNSCSSNSVTNVPYNAQGYQNAHSGVAYAGAVFFSQNISDFREYLEVPFIEPLLPDSCYNFQMYINLPNTCKFATNSIGIYFSDSLIQNIYFFPLTYTPQITYSGPCITDTSDWVLISGNYLAHGGESYVVIGNFNDSNSTNTIIVNNATWNTLAYYYIDDISLFPFEYCNLTSTSLLVSKDVIVYPSPVSNNLYIKYENTFPFQLIISDFSSRIILIDEFESSANINLSSLSQGIYYYKIISKGRSIENGKFVKI